VRACVRDCDVLIDVIAAHLDNQLRHRGAEEIGHHAAWADRQTVCRAAV